MGVRPHDKLLCSSSADPAASPLFVANWTSLDPDDLEEIELQFDVVEDRENVVRLADRW